MGTKSNLFVRERCNERLQKSFGASLRVVIKIVWKFFGRLIKPS